RSRPRGRREHVRRTRYERGSCISTGRAGRAARLAVALAVALVGGRCLIWGLDVRKRFHRRLGRRDRVAVGLLELGEDFLAVHIDRTRSLDPETYLVAAHFEDRHDDLVPDHDALIGTTRENKHEAPPSVGPLALAIGSRAYAVGAHLV